MHSDNCLGDGVADFISGDQTGIDGKPRCAAELLSRSMPFNQQSKALAGFAAYETRKHVRGARSGRCRSTHPSGRFGCSYNWSLTERSSQRPGAASQTQSPDFTWCLLVPLHRGFDGLIF
jgi:hypothetical protein